MYCMSKPLIRVKVFSTYPYKDASFRRRVIPMTKYLRSQKFEVETYSLFTNWMYSNRNRSQIYRLIVSLLLLMRLLLRIIEILCISKQDCIVIHREIFPFFLPKMEFFAIKRARKSVLDFDDAIFTNPTSGKDWRFNFRDGERLSDLVAKVDLVIVSSPYLENWTKEYSDQVVLLLTLPPKRIPINSSNSPRKIIWIGSDSGEPHLLSISNILNEISILYGVKVHILTGHKMLRSKWPDCFELQLWNEEIEEKFLNESCVGIMPLIQDEWSRGKGAYKIMQYMSAGIPFVGSDVGINGAIFGNLKSGFIVRNEDEWRKSLELLLTDSQIFQNFAENGHNWIEEKIRSISYSFLIPVFLGVESE